MQHIKIAIFEKIFSVKRVLCCLCLLWFTKTYSQTNHYFQQRVDFNIDVTLNVETKSLKANETITYTNNSPDTLKFIWLHIWPNAYKNDRTAFSEQMLQNGNTDFYFSDNDERGYINQLNFFVGDTPVILEDHPLYIDVAKLLLPHALAPRETISINGSFHVKLPYLFSRSGYKDDEFLITQWYPKPAVYDQNGWHEMPYLDQGEFYSEFGNYKVNITFPANYEVAASGILENSSIQGKDQTVSYYLNNAHDFAWFAFKNFIKDSGTIKSSDGHIVHLHSYYKKESKSLWKNSIDMMKDAFISREKWLGPYPYSNLSVVEAPDNLSGGMEYPTIATISPIEDSYTLQEVINHEIGHNWNYGILASNERQHPWMDEGINSFFTRRSMAGKYESPKPPKGFIESRMPEDPTDLVYRTLIAEKSDQPIETPSAAFSEANYYTIAYYKTDLWLQQLEKYIGRDAFDSCMKLYYEIWKFKHPQPSDFQNIFEGIPDKNIDSMFMLLSRKGYIVPKKSKQLKLAPLFSFRDTDKYNYIFLSPAIGYNYYDKIMAGLLVHNYTLPEPALHFFIAPMYATGSKSFTGMGRVGYSFRSYGPIRKTEISVSAAHFNMDEFTDSTGHKNFMAFSKIVPSIKLTFRNKNYRSHVNRFVQWKTYLITETSLLFTRDTIRGMDIITYPETNRYLNQLAYVFENSRVLYPYRYEIAAQQATDFLRLTAEANYFFNYAKGGGLNARLFGGKFLYLGDKTIYKKYSTSRYHLTMTGPNGYEDYTYSNYFVGRNEFEGAASQQIMIRDGGFKVRTDLLSNKIGKTDDWLAALNLNTSIPKKMNPLQVLPFDVDLRAFLDVGTYSEAWEKESTTGKFLYDAGLQLSLIKGIVNIYVPVLYSKVYSDYIKSTIPKNKRFLTNISFSIDIQKFRLQNFFNAGF